MTHTHRTLMIAAAALLCALPTPGQSAIFDRDDRQYVGVERGSPYSPVGLVSDDGLIVYHFTTGFLVDDCHVLTTQSSMGEGKAPLGKRMKFQTGLRTHNRQATRATVIAMGGFVRSDRSEDGLGRNWALLRLDKCVGASAGHVALATGPYSPYEFRDLMTASYPMHRSRGGGLTIDPSCTVTAGTRMVWRDDCSMVRGDSGAPVFRISPSTKQMAVYAMQAGGVSFSGRPTPLKPGYENRAVPMSLVAPQIAKYLSLGLSDKLVAAK